MISKKSIIRILVTIILFYSMWLEAYASSPFLWLETQISPTSSENKIKKMQSALSQLKIYSWEIDWKYESIEDTLINYQIKSWLIEAETDYWAWYFWIKTLTALQNDYPEEFEEVSEKYLQIEPPSNDNRYFYITAYYSPLPGQRRYTTWSYEWDLKLNGSWKHTASWKEVFEWILAAPTNYSFWTKIEFEWVWVWVVEDRWWAIVSSWEEWQDYDRIDIWMGYWDYWLARALKWWTRKIMWKVVPETRELSIEFWFNPAEKYSDLKVDAEKPTEESVKDLQNLMTEINVYTWAIDWNFESVKDEFIKYQVDNNIISSKNDPQAGYFWEKTVAFIRKSYDNDAFKKQNNKLDEDVILSQEIKEKLNILNLKISATIDKKYWKNTPKAIEYRKKLRQMIDKQLYKTKNEDKKKQLKYIKSLL